MTMAGRLDLGKVRGTTIYTGTEITGVDANGKKFPESGITKAYEEDLYVNTDVNSESQGNVYICLTGGDADTAVWAYNGNLRGPQCEVINNLESSRTDAALTAYQGRILKDIMYDSGLITKEVEIDYSGNVQGIKVTTENRETTITVQTASGNITQEKAAGAETTTVSVVPAKQILKVSSSDAYIRKIELYDASNNLVYTDNISSWGAIEDIRQQMEESGTVVDGDDTLATGILAKVKNGVKKVFYPISHAKAIWYSIKENKTVYDVIAGLLTKTNELSETTTALTENIFKKTVMDLDNPPTAFILNTGTNPVGLPKSLGSNGCLVIQHNPGSEYTAQLAFSFGSYKIAIRIKQKGEWSDWKYFTAS